MATTPETVKTDKPAKAPKERKPRVKKELDFTAPEKSGKVDAERIAKMAKSELRKVADENGYNRLVVSYCGPREARAYLTEDYPIEMKGYNVDARTVKNEAELIEVIAERYRKFAELEAVRTKERAAEHAAARALAGVDEEVAPGPEFTKARLANAKVLVPVSDEVKKGERFVDIDGSGGRRSFYEFVEKEDLTAKGTPKAKAQVVRISPQAWTEIREDSAFMAKFDVPEGFGVPAKKEPKPKLPKATKGATKGAASSKKAKTNAAEEAAAQIDEVEDVEIEEDLLDIPEDL